jgi:predicted nucleic acid-binding protein
VNWLLDTNVLSELVKPRPDANVVGWTGARSSLDFALSVLTLGELEKGIARLPSGPRRTQLRLWARSEIPRQFLGRLLPVDEPVALAWGELAAAAQADGRPLPVIDGLLLGTARVAGLILVTRNVSDCAGRGVAVYDPWTDILHGP